jgi:hypothetical protein
MTEDEELEYLQLKKKKAMAQMAELEAPSQAVRQELRNPVTGMRAALDATASIGTGAVAGPVSGLAGIAGSVLPGPEGQGADWQRRASEFLTRQPQTPGGQLIVDTATAPFQWLANKADQAGGAVSEATGSPAVGAGVNAALQLAPAAIGKMVQKPLGAAVQNAKTKLAGEASRNSVKDATYKAAVEEGYVVPQSAYDPTWVGNRIEGLGGKAAVRQQAEVANQQVTNKIARRESGLGPDDPLSEATLAAARDRMSAPYAEVAAVSPRAKVALEKMKQNRADSKLQWKHYNASSDPAVLTKAKALDQRAGAYERLIEVEARKAGRPGLLAELRQARENLAKNFTVERALNVADGNVDALVIGRLRDKGSPMTGGLKTIGDFANAFRQFARQESKVPAAGVSKSEWLAGGLLGTVGGSALGPFGSLMGVLPLLSPAARAVALRGAGPRKYQPNAALRSIEATARAFPSANLIGISQDQ